MFVRWILITKPPLPPSLPQLFKRSCIRDTGFFGKDFLLSNGLENEDFLSPCLVLFLKGLLRNFSCLSEGLFGPFFDELFGPIGSFLPIRAKHPSFMTYKRRRVPEVRQQTVNIKLCQQPIPTDPFFMTQVLFIYNSHL